ncbi:LicD family protein [Bacteroides sp.]
MIEITNFEVVKDLQLDVLSALDSFCQEHNITYTIIDGTLLGAVRHRGYIPWDDDIDIAFDRKNYDRLILEFPKSFDGKYEILSLERDSEWDRAYAFMYDNRTILTYSNNASKQTGVGIDLFPVDEVPEDETSWNILKKRMAFLSKLSALKSSTQFSISRSIITNVIAGICKIVLIPVSKRTIALWQDSLAKSNNGKGYTLGYEVAFGLGASSRFHLKDFKDVVEYPFEDRYFKGLKNADSVLTDTYGDYMQLPPVEKRITHHSFVAYWK